MNNFGLSLMGLGLLGFGIACSDRDPADDAEGKGGAASGGQQSGGSPGSGGDASGGKASGGASGGQGTGGADGTGGGSGGTSRGASAFDDHYAMMERLCRPGGYVDVELDLPSTSVSDGVGLIARSSDDVVEGEMRHLTFKEIPPNFQIHFAWPASAEGGVEVEASGTILSSGRPEYNFCFAGKALVATDIEGDPYHIVASDDVTIANDDGTCTDTKVAGTIAFCVAAEF